MEQISTILWSCIQHWSVYQSHLFEEGHDTRVSTISFNPQYTSLLAGIMAEWWMTWSCYYRNVSFRNRNNGTLYYPGTKNWHNLTVWDYSTCNLRCFVNNNFEVGFQRTANLPTQFLRIKKTTQEHNQNFKLYLGFIKNIGNCSQDVSDKILACSHSGSSVV